MYRVQEVLPGGRENKDNESSFQTSPLRCKTETYARITAKPQLVEKRTILKPLRALETSRKEISVVKPYINLKLG